MSDNIIKRGDVWWLKVQVAGVVYRRSLRTGSRSVAKRLAALETDKIKEFAVTGEQNRLYKEAVVRWTREVLSSKEPSTARRYKASARQLTPTFGTLSLREIRPATIAAHVSARKKAGATDVTIRRDLTALSSILRACVSWGWLETNAAKLWDRSSLSEDRLTIDRLDDAAMDMVCAEAPPMLASLLRFLLLTGMRLDEAAGLTWKRYDKSAGTVFIAKTKTKDPRTISISRRAAKLLAGLPVAIECPYVFHHSGATRYTSASSLFGKVRQRAQLKAQAAKRDLQPFRIHDLRHEYAIRELENGRGIYELSKHLGHTSVTTTERFYLRFRTADQQDEARKARA